MTVEELVEFDKASPSNSTYKHALCTKIIDENTELHVAQAILERYFDTSSCVTDLDGIQRLREPDRFDERQKISRVISKHVIENEALREEIEKLRKEVSKDKKKI